MQQSFMKKRILATIALLTLIIVSAQRLSLAQSAPSGSGFRISPVRQELSLAPGTSRTVEIAVENITSAPITAHAIVNDFVADSSEKGEPKLVLDTSTPPGSTSFRGLVKSIPDLTLAVKERKIIKVSLTVPPNGASGGYYGAIRFAPVSTDNQNQVSLSASVGTLYLITVPGNITEKLGIESLSVSRHGKAGSFFLTSPDNVSVRLKNTGNIHVKPFGKIAIKNSQGKSVSDVEVNPAPTQDARGNVLPNSIRRFDTAVKSHFGLGHYSVTANIAYGSSGSALLSAKTSFWIVPLWLIITVGVLLVLIILVIVFLLFRRKKRRYKQRTL
ncbi:MAG: hypothetical protein JWS12_914 [Candidatus Saccharibacteria bacterium]|nr:hypothetical protein [Candidatus Saccharibacteria bacterium]